MSGALQTKKRKKEKVCGLLAKNNCLLPVCILHFILFSVLTIIRKDELIII